MHPTFCNFPFRPESYSSNLDASKLARQRSRERGRSNLNEVFIMADTDLISTYRRIADILRSVQRAAIEVENAPDKRKRLRTFSSQEVASLLGVPHREV